MERPDWRSRLAAQGITLHQFVFQLVVVTIGVFIAVALQSRAENRAHREDAAHMLEAIDAELGKDLQEIDIVRKNREDHGEGPRVILQETRTQDLDTMVQRKVREGLHFNRTFFSRRAAYSTLLSSGLLGYVTDPRLRLELAQLYEHDYVRMTNNGDAADKIWQTVFRAALNDYWDFDHGHPIDTGAGARVHMANAKRAPNDLQYL